MAELKKLKSMKTIIIYNAIFTNNNLNALIFMGNLHVAIKIWKSNVEDEEKGFYGKSTNNFNKFSEIICSAFAKTNGNFLNSNILIKCMQLFINKKREMFWLISSNKKI